MGFFAPWFLAGLAAVSVPVFIHLLRRHTTTPRPVSSLMFFERGTQSSTRHRRLRYLLLFALRALLVVLLALAFANPFVRRSSVSASEKLLVIAIDDSFSMRAGTRLADAKRAALVVLEKRAGAEHAQVMVLGGDLAILTQSITDSTQLKAAIDGIGPGDSHSNFGELGRGMRALAETVHTPIELHLFSDMQESNMSGNFADMVMPGNVSLVLHPVVTGTIPNWTVESVEAPGQLVEPKKAHVVAVIAGHETPAARRTVSLVVNGAVTATKQIDVPADGRATVAFDGLDVPFGESRCAVKIDSADGFSGDDASLFAVKRADPERVLFVHQASDTRSPLYFGAALAAAAQASFVLQPITPEQAADADPARYAFVVLSDVPAIPTLLENNLAKSIDNGGSALIAEGTAGSHRERIPVFGGAVSEGRYYARAGGAAAVTQVNASHPVLKDAAGWPDVKFFYASVVDAGKARVLARLGDGTPLLLDRQIGQGHALLFTSGLDNVTNDLPLHPEFVAFVDRTARYLAGMERTAGPRLVDTFVQLRSPANEPARSGRGSVVVVGPDGQRPLSLTEEASAQTLPLKQAGFYQIRFPSGRETLVAVNPDPRESSLKVIPDDVLGLWSGNPAASPDQTTAVVARKADASVWWWVMLLVLIAAATESVVASGYLGTQREEA
jgi:hypothetical protein